MTLNTEDIAAVRSDDAQTTPEAESYQLLKLLIEKTFANSICVAASFGAESAVLLHLVATVNPNVPVIFNHTGKLFGETLRYRDQLVALLGLRDVREIRPEPIQLSAEDPDGHLWLKNPDRCCYLRKVEPFNRAIADFDAVISGRKAFHGALRSNLETLEASGDGKIRVNPLLAWQPDDLTAYAATHDLPPHPLVADGYASIGCMPCTDRATNRAGRWRGQDKTECGIHLSPIA
jgi:phosphoadenosine phosphosulfate reductase